MSNDEDNPRPFSVLPGNHHLKTGVRLPRDAFGISPVSRELRPQETRERKPILSPRYKDPVAEAYREMLSADQKYPQEDEEDDDPPKR